MSDVEKLLDELDEIVSLPQANRLREFVAELEAKVPRWIPVERRLPEQLEVVLVWPHLDAPISAFVNELGLWISAENEESDLPLFHVTHWMPLPEAPK